MLTDSFFNTNQNFFNPEYLKNFNDLTPSVKQHLTKVYLTLSCMLAATSFGVWLNLSNNFYLSPGFSVLLTLASCLGLLFTSNHPDTSSLRQGLLLTFSVCEGFALSPLINLAINIDQKLLLIASTSTFILFSSFTLSSMLTQRRSYLYLGGILGSATFVLFWISLANSFLHYKGLFTLELYGGLIVFSLYVLYDTQKIIEQANRGYKGVINHALTLFSDFISIFVRILIILIKKNQESERKKDRRERRQSGGYSAY